MCIWLLFAGFFSVLISALTQAVGGGLFFRFTCSVVLREGGALQTDIAVCGEHSQCSGHTGFAPLMGMCSPRLHCSGSWLLYMELALRCVWFQFWVFHKSADLVGPVFFAFPGRSSSGSQELDGLTLPGCSTPSPLRGPSLSFRMH